MIAVISPASHCESISLHRIRSKRSISKRESPSLRGVATPLSSRVRGLLDTDKWHHQTKCTASILLELPIGSAVATKHSRSYNEEVQNLNVLGSSHSATSGRPVGCDRKITSSPDGYWCNERILPMDINSRDSRDEQETGDQGKHSHVSFSRGE